MKKDKNLIKNVVYLLLFFITIVIVARASAQQNNSIINTGDNFQFCEGEICIDSLTPTDFIFPTLEDIDKIPTPTFVPTPTDITNNDQEGDREEGNINLPCLFGCPSPTVIQTPTTAPTPTTTPQPTLTPTPGPIGGGSNPSSPSSSSSTSPSGETLGTSTMAVTGSFMDMLITLIGSLGIAMMAVASRFYFLKLRNV